MGLPNPEKKTWSWLCPWKNEIKSPGQERRELDKMQCENFKMNIYIDLAVG